jgi:hypothetical protein
MSEGTPRGELSRRGWGKIEEEKGWKRRENKEELKEVVIRTLYPKCKSFIIKLLR